MMESGQDFMRKLRNFKPYSLGCAVARRKSSTTLIFPPPQQACSETCVHWPHNVKPTPGYWIECSAPAALSRRSSTSEEKESDEGITESDHNSFSDTFKVGLAEVDASQLALASQEQEVHETFFFGKEHWNYFTNDEDLGPIILTFKQENINGRDQFRILLRGVSCTLHGLIPSSSVYANRYDRDEVVASLGREIGLKPPLTLGQLPNTPEELLKLDQVFLKSELKVGVMYVREGQYSEEQILDNNEHSQHFENFLALLGDKVRLKGFDRYKGGLDTVNDLTGEYSVFTCWRQIELMFHVSTLLPHEASDSQKLQRKRHIGNDIVCIVFLEADDNTLFSPSCIKSHFLHTFVVVKCNPTQPVNQAIYEMSVITRDEVGAFRPFLQEQSVFHEGPFAREWLLTKVVNGERASYLAPKFARMQERTRGQMLEDIVANLQNHAETGQIPKPYRRGSWRPIGHMRPSSPLLDSVRDVFEGHDLLASDFGRNFADVGNRSNLFDVAFLVGQGKIKTRLYGVRAILAVRSRGFQELLYGMSSGLGSLQVPVAELLTHGLSLKSSRSNSSRVGSNNSNFLQVPEIELTRPKSVPSSPSIPRAFTNLRKQLSSAWKRKHLSHEIAIDDGESRRPLLRTQARSCEDAKTRSHEPIGLEKRGSSCVGMEVPQLSLPHLSVSADAQRIDKSKLTQTEFTIIEFDSATFTLLLTYLHTGSCSLSCLSIPGLICAAEHFDLPELLQACFHHAKQFIRVPVCCPMLCALESYYWRYTSASELVNMILAYSETRALPIFRDNHFMQLSESMVQMIMSRDLDVPELAKFEAMLRWSKHKIRHKTFSNPVDAKIEFRCCMDRLTRDLKLCRIAPHDLIRTVLPSKAIRNEKIMETLMVQAQSGMYRVQKSYLDACTTSSRPQSDCTRLNQWESFDMH